MAIHTRPRAARGNWGGNEGTRWSKNRHFQLFPQLTESECRNARCPDPKARIRLADSGGLYLEVTPISKRWFWKYRFVRKEKRLALGMSASYNHATYPRERRRMMQARAGHLDAMRESR
jgi:hypothetical protein